MLNILESSVHLDLLSNRALNKAFYGWPLLDTSLAKYRECPSFVEGHSVVRKECKCRTMSHLL